MSCYFNTTLCLSITAPVNITAIAALLWLLICCCTNYAPSDWPCFAASKSMHTSAQRAEFRTRAAIRPQICMHHYHVRQQCWNSINCLLPLLLLHSSCGLGRLSGRGLEDIRPQEHGNGCSKKKPHPPRL